MAFRQDPIRKWRAKKNILFPGVLILHDFDKYELSQGGISVHLFFCVTQVWFYNEDEESVAFQILMEAKFYPLQPSVEDNGV